MAKEKKCKECKKEEKDCRCKKPGRIGWYGLEKDDKDDATTDHDQMADAVTNGGMEGGAMGEAVKMPEAPQDSDKDMQGMSTEKKQKKLSAFRAAADDAKKRQGDEDRKAELAQTRRTKGIRFYDSKGSGYIKGGKKHYD